MEIRKEPYGNNLYCLIFEFNYERLEICRVLSLTHGRSNFRFVKGRWRFNNLDYLEIIKEAFVNEEVVVAESVMMDVSTHELKKAAEAMKMQKAEIIKNKLDSDIIIPGLKGELYPYQKVGVEFFENGDGRTILADKPGVGKSLQALAHGVYSGYKKMLIICPASVKYSWEKEVEKWTKLKSFVISSKNKLTNEHFMNNNVFIINYDIVVKYVDLLTSLRFDCLVCDEFHYVKNRFSKRTKATIAVSKNISSVLLLSGTPVLNRPVELFTGLHILHPKVWSNWYAYTTRYCNGHKGDYGWDATGASHLDELTKKISPYFLRRTKEQVLSQLPPKIIIDMPVELDKENALMYRTEENGVADKLSSDEDFDAVGVNALVLLNNLRQITSRGKIYAAKDVINNVIENGEKILVFSVYNEPLETLKEEYGDSAVVITGKVSEDDRRKAIDDFQNDNTKNIFLGGMKSSGVGITLTAASNVLFIDYSWVPADHEQAADRCHRPGQVANSVNIYQLHAKNTMDDYMRSVIDGKKKLLELVVDSNTSDFSTENIYKDVFKDLLKSLKLDK